MKIQLRFIKCFTLIFFLFAFNSIFAADSTSTVTKKPFKPKYYLNVGAFQPTVSTTLQINGKYGPGAVFSLEDNLGFSAHPWLFRVEGIANFTKRSGVLLAYVNLNRKQEWNVDRDVNIFDTTFHIGAKLGIFFNTTFIAASYKYTVFAKPDWDAGLSVGIRFLQIKTGVSLETANFSNYAESVTIPAPVPVLGVFGSAYMTNRLRVRYNLDYFTISVKGVRGGVIDNRIALEYFFIKNLGIGAAVNFLSYQIKEIPLEKNFSGDIKYSLSGFSFFVAARF